MNREEAGVFDRPESTVELSVRREFAGPRAMAAERWLVRRLLHRLHDPSVRIVMWDGQEIASSGRTPAARVVLRDRGALYRLLANPDLQFGELYSEGRIAIQGDLVAFLEAVCRAASGDGTFKDYRAGWSTSLRSNTLARSRADIHRHYDIGNEFYRLWLDERMVYTCAYFRTPDLTLEAAQVAKMELVCRKLRLCPGEMVVEAGCGWGSLALHMARHHGVRVRAFNISHEQVILARERARAEGLDRLVEFVEDDYRNITGKYDAFVSVGMLEHVGPEHYRALGGVIDRSLTPSGRGLIHSIGRNRPLRPNAWILARIFPGAYPPSLKEMTDIFEPYSFSVLDVENLRLHYAATLRHWVGRFEANQEQVRRMFDERFVRMWRLYLASSLAAFTTGWMQLFQVVFTRAANNDVPMTREYLYPTGR